MKEANTASPSPARPATAAPAWQVRGKFLGIGLLLGLVLGGIGAGKIYFDSRGQVEAAEQQANTLQAREQALQARAAVASAGSELSRQNFGTAREKLTAAKKLLAAVDAGAAGLDPAALKAVQERLAGVEISTEGGQGMTVSTLEEIGLALDKSLLRGG